MSTKSRAGIIAAIAVTVAVLTGCSATDAPADPVSTVAPKTTTPAAPKAPQATVAQQQALIAAKGYLSMGSGFSEAGLLQQLTSSAGDGFSKADAEWAIAHSGADWNAQAVEAAKGYMQMGGFSRKSLIDQLTSSAGSGFTPAQAAYAASKVGL